MKSTNKKVIDYLLAVIDRQSAHIEQLGRDNLVNNCVIKRDTERDALQARIDGLEDLLKAKEAMISAKCEEIDELRKRLDTVFIPLKTINLHSLEDLKENMDHHDNNELMLCYWAATGDIAPLTTFDYAISSQGIALWLKDEE